MKKKEENLTYEEYVRLRETRRLGETKKIIKQTEEQEKQKKYEEKQRLQLIKEEQKLVKKEESIATKTLNIARILSENGIDLTKIKLSKKVGEKQEYLLLKEIEQDGIDIQKIIEENGLDEDFKLGMRVVNLRTAYNDSGTYRITQEEKKEAEELGLIPRTLKRKFEQKQIAIDKRRKAKELYDRWMKSDRERLIV